MNLRSDWKRIIKKAWSFRLMALAGLLSGLEVALPLFMHTMPRGLFATLAIIVTTAAPISRVVAQKGMKE